MKTFAVAASQEIVSRNDLVHFYIRVHGGVLADWVLSCIKFSTQLMLGLFLYLKIMAKETVINNR